MTNNVPLHKLIYNYLKEANEEKSLTEIYQYLSLNDLYKFNTATPKQVVRVTIERKTLNTNFSDTHNETLFYKRDNKYGLVEWISPEERKKLKNVLEKSTVDEESIESIGEEVGEQLEYLKARINKIEENTENYLAFEKEYKNLLEIKKDIEQVKQDFINDKKVLFEKFESKENDHKDKLVEIVHSLESFANDKHLHIDQTADGFFVDVEKTEHELQRIKKQAEEILKFSEQAGIAQYYEDKATKKKIESWIYLGSFVLSIIIAFTISLFIVLLEIGNIDSIAGLNFDMNGKSSLAIKFTLYIPILILSSFMWKMFADSKRLFEVYDHKSILAKSISINQKILAEDNDMNKEQIIEKSTAKSLDSILESPFRIKHSESNNSDLMKITETLAKKIDLNNKV